MIPDVQFRDNIHDPTQRTGLCPFIRQPDKVVLDLADMDPATTKVSCSLVGSARVLSIFIDFKYMEYMDLLMKLPRTVGPRLERSVRASVPAGAGTGAARRYDLIPWTRYVPIWGKGVPSAGGVASGAISLSGVLVVEEDCWGDWCT